MSRAKSNFKKLKQILFLGVALFCFKPTLEAQSVRTTKEAQSELMKKFLILCDSAVVKLNLPERENQAWGKKTPVFYIDSYVVRGLMAAYDMTGNEAYLNASKTWCNRMIAFQEKMIPAGFYYMNYGRKPGETTGDVYNGDNGSMAMGILATAIRCKNKSEKQFYLNSAEAYAKLVMENYVGPNGGITDGIWRTYNGEWWCSSGTVGSFFFLLYRETGKKPYLQIALNAIKYLNDQDLNTVGPLPLKDQGPSLPMYTFEAYSAGFPYISKNPQLYAGAKKQIRWFKNWAANYQYNDDGQWGSKYGGIPFHLAIWGKINSDAEMEKMSNEKLEKVLNVLFAKKSVEVSQLTAFTMLSMAEKLRPGLIYRSDKHAH